MPLQQQAKRRLELGESGHQYLSDGLKTPKGKGRAALRSPDSPKSKDSLLSDSVVWAPNCQSSWLEGCRGVNTFGMFGSFSFLSVPVQKINTVSADTQPKVHGVTPVPACST
uniref:E2F transcription factor 3 n=1 Tax=Molossus molossus TaxID=27622 RepID=A0A7J8F7J4_MOLMO|nr:E2F transcription factor 3 [Molossus molossus]